jgi:hypothetical protein
MTEPTAPEPKREKKPKPVKTKPAKPPVVKKVKPPRRRAPILLELTYTLFMLIVLGATVTTAVISLLAGADLLMVVVRTGGVLLTVGFILWVVYWLVATGIIEARRQQVLEEASRQKAAAEKASSTMEFEA